MIRVEFIETLSRLLQDFPEEDRIDALKYYNDYFDDAGSENEQNVIEELESPEKVAMKIKADREDTEDGKEGGTEKTTEEASGKVTGENAAYSGAREQHDRENTYQYYQEDTYGEEKDNKIYQDNGTYDYESQEKKPWTNKWLKLAMIIAIVVIGFPIVIPLGAGILALIAGIVIAVFCLFAAIVIGFAAVVMVGVVLFAAGIGSLFANPGVGLAVLGAGLMVIAIGVIGTVVGVRLCIIVFPGIVRGIVYFKKTISQKGGGIRDEETLENILDRVWFYVSDRNHMLFGILGNGNEPDRYSTSISTWDQLGIRR